MPADRQPVAVPVGEGQVPGTPWSPSSIESFLGCPLRYWWQKVARWETPSTVPLVVGRAVHEALEHLLALDPEQRTAERGEAFLADAVSHALAEAPEVAADEVRTKSDAAMAAYWTVETPAEVAVVPAGIEREVTADLRGLPLRGFIDRIAEVDVGHRVTDYKTGAAKPKYWWGYWRQQLLYAAALEAADEPVAEIELLFLTGPRAVTRPVYPAATARALDDLERAQEQRAAMTATSRWEARPGPLCSWCDFRFACPTQRPGAAQPGTEASDERLLQAGLRRRPLSVPDVETLVEEQLP